MRAVTVVVTAASALALCLAAPAADAAGILATIIQPDGSRASFGETELVAHVVSSQSIVKVEFFVDGRLVGTLTERPYRLLVDVGEENRPREFAIVVHGASGLQVSDEVRTPRLQIDEQLDVSLQQLYVTVTRDGRRVLELQRDDFRVVDNGVEQQLVTFERGDIPFTAVLLLDSSESMKGQRLQTALDGAKVFLTRLQELDEAKAILFSDRVLVSSPFSNQNADFLAELEGTLASGGTALNDHLFAALEMLEHRQGRRVVILLSDGADVVSVLRMQDVLWKIRRTNSLIYWIRLREETHVEASFSSSWRDLEANVREVQQLERAVKESGGRVAELRHIDEVERAFDEILRELRDQYVLGYYPTDQSHGGSWREVKVSTRGWDTRVRTREGYVDH